MDRETLINAINKADVILEGPNSSSLVSIAYVERVIALLDKEVQLQEGATDDKKVWMNQSVRLQFKLNRVM